MRITDKVVKAVENTQVRVENNDVVDKAGNHLRNNAFGIYVEG